MTKNTLYYGDNLDILRRYIQDESVDLVYLDPPFKGDSDYNVLFAEQDGSRAAAQIKAFGDMILSPSGGSCPDRYLPVGLWRSLRELFGLSGK